MNIDEIIAENERLKKQNADLQQEVRAANNTIRRAKDINPVERPSLKRVLKLAADACMTLAREGGRWILRLGNLTRSFKRLGQLWELLIKDEWVLSEIFPPPEPPKERRSFFPPPWLKKRNPSIAPPASYGPSDVTFQSTG